MPEMTPERWERTQDYLHETFGRSDERLESLLARAKGAGLPDIAVGPEVGRLLSILTSATRGRVAIEVGTLGGYSGVWIARALAPGGRLITIESEDRHADFAEREFERAGVGDRVNLLRGKGLDVLPALARELEPGSVDLVFLDAIKTEYPKYWDFVRPLIAVGGFIVADNALGAGSWWIDDERHESARAARRFNSLVAEDPDFEAVAVPLRQGVMFGRRMR